LIANSPLQTSKRLPEISLKWQHLTKKKIRNLSPKILTQKSYPRDFTKQMRRRNKRSSLCREKRIYKKQLRWAMESRLMQFHRKFYKAKTICPFIFELQTLSRPNKINAIDSWKKSCRMKNRFLVSSQK